MSKTITKINFSLYALMSFTVAYYAFLYLFLIQNPSNEFELKMLSSGWIPPVHFITGGLALALTPFQLSLKLRRYSIKLHRTIGIFYAILVFIGGLTGLVMALNASGGLAGKLGFLNLALLWLFTTTLAVYFALKGEINKHRKWIYRSVAVTAAAITFRILLGVGLSLLQLPFLVVFVSASWLCWILNLMLCEWVLYRKGLTKRTAQLNDAVL